MTNVWTVELQDYEGVEVKAVCSTREVGTRYVIDNLLPSGWDYEVVIAPDYSMVYGRKQLSEDCTITSHWYVQEHKVYDGKAQDDQETQEDQSGEEGASH